MNKKVRISIFFSFCVLSLQAAVAASVFEWENVSQSNTDIRAVLIHPDNASIIYYGAKNAIFKSIDKGNSSRMVCSFGQGNKGVNYLMLDPQDKNIIYAATRGGLYVSRNQGQEWKRIFKGRNAFESECTHLLVFPKRIYLGTGSGLFISMDKGRTWRKEPGEIGKTKIFSLATGNDGLKTVYAASVQGVFKTSQSAGRWEKVYSAISSDKDNNFSDSEEDTDEQELSSPIRYLCCQESVLSQVFIATSRGVFRSKDKGLNWEPLPEYGLLSKDINLVFVNRNNLFAVTRSGIFVFESDRWRELSFNLTANEIRFLAFDKENTAYAACDNGLFRMAETIANAFIPLRLNYASEPKIKDVQKAAIKYAEVDAQKIIRWRKLAAKKAMMPRVSASVNRDTSDLWHWESGSTTKNYDDVLIKGNESIGWDVTFTWDLGELIWNSEQTSIDTRSRLMVQLRDDILDEVNKLYFERLRIKAELDALSIEDRKRRIEKELRIEELNASLDALTGGYFSEHLPS